MIVLDENFSREMRQLLQSWRISVRHISYDIGREGMRDEEVITLLHKLRRPTFFTFDFDFYKSRLCHSKYSLVCLAVRESDSAEFVRRLLRHREFDTQAGRMGTVIRVAQPGLTVWRLHAEQEANYAWYE